MPKTPAGIRKLWSWLFACMYLIGLPAGFAVLTGTATAGFVFALCALLFIGQAWSITPALRTRFWPSVAGKVISVRITRQRDGKPAGAWRYTPEITYRYSVDGRTYENGLLSFSRPPVSTPDRQQAKAIAARYPRESRVRVYYNPRRPEYAALEAGPGVRAWLLLVCFLLAAAACGAYITARM